MRSLQNSLTKNDWSKVVSALNNAYLCPKTESEMFDEALSAEPNNEDLTLKPYSMEEIDAMIEESERDFAAGRVYTTEEVIKMCMEGVSK